MIVTYICTSYKCTGSHIHPGVKKEVKYGTDYCPDCKCLLLKKKQRNYVKDSPVKKDQTVSSYVNKTNRSINARR